MNSLFVCHSAGDTNALIASAEELLKKNSQCKPVFLIIGSVAEKQWHALPIDSTLKNSSTVEIIPKEFIQESENSTLNEKDFEVVKVKILDSLIKKYEISNVLIGTPSQNQSSLAFQIAEYLIHHFKNDHLFVYNDYLFEEKAHCYWQVINNNEESWAEKINWLVPLPTPKAKINDINPLLNVSVVGHLSIDTALSAPSIDKNKVRQALAVGDTQSLLFISGSKDFSKDKELIEALFQALEKNPNPELELRLGVHPGVTDPNAYIIAILKVVYQFPAISHQIKLLVKPCLMEQLLFTRDNQLFEKTIPTSLSSDEIACTANGIASAPPATLVTVAALQGKPAYYHEEDKASYLPPNRILFGKDKLPSFFSAIKNKEDQQPITRSKLGLTEKTFVQVMSDKLTSDELIPESLSLTP